MTDPDKKRSFGGRTGSSISTTTRSRTSIPRSRRFRKRPGSRLSIQRTSRTTTPTTGRFAATLTQGKDIGKDLVVFTDPFAARMIREGLAQELDRDNIPNSRNVRTDLVDVDFDPGRRHSLTWQSGFTGL